MGKTKMIFSIVELLVQSEAVNITADNSLVFWFCVLMLIEFMWCLMYFQQQ